MAEKFSLNRPAQVSEEEILRMRAERKKEAMDAYRLELIKSAISGLAMTELTYPGKQAQNAIKLADAVIAELDWK